MKTMLRKFNKKTKEISLTLPSKMKAIPKNLKEYPNQFKAYSKKKKILISIISLVLIILVVFSILAANKKTNVEIVGTEGVVERQDIIASVTGSAVVNPKEQYSITALVSGDVLAADFEQGDIVKEGDVLYKIDSSDAQNTIENANISHERSQMEYNKALENYDKLTVNSDCKGVIKQLYVKNGAPVNQGMQIADIYDDSYLILTITFNDADAQNIYAGQNATVRVSSNGETLNGTVTSVNSQGYAAQGNTLVRTVKIKVQNPGVLTNTETATAMIGDFACSSAGTFEYITEKTITAEASGTIDAVYVMEGSRVSNGTKLVHIKSSSISDSLKSAELSLKSSQLSQDNAKKKLEDYTIKAPISGTVVTKNVKAGDKLDNTNMSTEMAVIYDMSSLECELNVDELDIKNIELGQSVIITSDAVSDKKYNGEVTNVSVNGTTSGGVTTYPVTINITDFDEELLPGMNIDVEIITSKAKGVLAVPVTAVNRGNTVYVKGDKTDEKDMAPDGFKSVIVETGTYNNEYIEIKSGINEGDIIYVPQIKASDTNVWENMMGMHNDAMMGGGMPGGGMSGGGMPGGGMSGGNGMMR